MKKKRVVRKSRSRKELAELAGGLAGARDVAGFLSKKGLLPSKVVRALLAKNAAGVMGDMRTVIAVRKYLLLEISKEVLDEVCREGEGDEAAVGRGGGEAAEVEVVLSDEELRVAKERMLGEG